MPHTLDGWSQAKAVLLLVRFGTAKKQQKQKAVYHAVHSTHKAHLKVPLGPCDWHTCHPLCQHPLLLQPCVVLLQHVRQQWRSFHLALLYATKLNSKWVELWVFCGPHKGLIAGCDGGCGCLDNHT